MAGLFSSQMGPNGPLELLRQALANAQAAGRPYEIGAANKMPIIGQRVGGYAGGTLGAFGGEAIEPFGGGIIGAPIGRTVGAGVGGATGEAFRRGLLGLLGEHSPETRSLSAVGTDAAINGGLGSGGIIGPIVATAHALSRQPSENTPTANSQYDQYWADPKLAEAASKDRGFQYSNYDPNSSPQVDRAQNPMSAPVPPMEFFKRMMTGVNQPGLTGLDPRFFDDPRILPIQRRLSLDTPQEGNRGYIVEMAHPGPAADVQRSGGWDSAPVGTGSPSDWFDGTKRITSQLTMDLPDESLKALLQKLSASKDASTNLGTGGALGEGTPNFADKWMFDTAKSVAGSHSTITPEMIGEFRRRMLLDLNHRAEMSY